MRHPPTARPIKLVNSGFESETPDPNGDPQGWYTGQHAGETSYLFTVDSTAKHGGAQSLRIDNVGRQPFGSIVQVVAAPGLGGKSVRFSAWLRTRAADADGASLFIIAETGGNVMAEGSAVRGTHDWARHSVTLAIPAQADRLRVGATLRGTGTVWLDDAELEIVSAR